MSDYLDILAQKYISDDCTIEELAEVEKLKADTYWNELVLKYKSIDTDLQKLSYLKKAKTIVSKRNSKRRILIPLIAAAAALIIGVMVVPNLVNNASEDQIAEHSGDKSEEKKTKSEAATDAVEEGDGAAEPERVDDMDSEYRDREITDNKSVFNFDPINNSFKQIKESLKSADIGIIELIAEINNPDSVYSFSINYNDVEYEKNIRLLGVINTDFYFNLISYKGAERDSRRSILVFDGSYEYIGRFVVSTVDHLPDYIQDDKLVFENVGVNNLSFRSEVDLENDDCIDLPEGMTSCLARF